VFLTIVFKGKTGRRGVYSSPLVGNLSELEGYGLPEVRLVSVCRVVSYRLLFALLHQFFSALLSAIFFNVQTFTGAGAAQATRQDRRPSDQGNVGRFR
jgi:hypothetical protein